MGKMIHATIHETEYQVTVQVVFRKPENLSQSSSLFYNDERTDHYSKNSERSSPFSSAFNSDGNIFKLNFATKTHTFFFLHIDEYSIEKPHKLKGKKRSKKRPQSATTIKTESVRINK